MIQNANCFEEHDSYLVLAWVSCHHGINSISGLLWMLILDLHNASISVWIQLNRWNVYVLEPQIFFVMNLTCSAGQIFWWQIPWEVDV